MTSQAAFGPPFFRQGTFTFKVRCPIILKVNVPSSPGWQRAALAMTLATVTLAACTTQRLYEGPPLSDAERAVVRADPAVSAGLPVSIRLRRVDAREVSISSRSVALAPGAHSFLVDCRVEESGSVRRFVVEREVEAGGRYRFVAKASTRNCEAVELIRD